MPNKIKRQHGLWDSPITPGMLAHDRRLEAAYWDSDGQTLVWLEGRSGRGVLVVQTMGDGAPRDLTSEIDVRAEVGYAGGDFTVQGGDVFFVEKSTGKLFRQSIAGGPAQAITPSFGKIAAPVVSPNGRWVAFVHHDEQQIDRLGVVDREGRHWPKMLATGHDFYMQPRWSPDSKRLAWIAWDHPNMPWDGTVLEVADVVESGNELPATKDIRTLAGGDDIAVFQPEFTPDGTGLLFVSDETGWARIALRDLVSGDQRWLTPEGVEFSQPAWLQDIRTYAVLADGQIIAAGNEAGFQRLVRVPVDGDEPQRIPALEDITELRHIAAAPAGDSVAVVGSGVHSPARVVYYGANDEKAQVIARSSGETIAASSLAGCEAITWETAGGETAHGLLFEPASDRFEGAGKPPLIVLVHGGPTSQVRAGWKADAQFFATRGYAVLFANYRGGTGYGREYMLRLRGNWGICDVEDSISGLRHLADAGRVDKDRSVIMGGSAGGFTVLHTMTQHPEVFTAGINLFGVSDQFHLAAETHKFESRYLDTLLGPLPEAAAVYRERSPAFHADHIRRPLAIYQGDIDRVVPREQSDMIAEVLKRNGVPHEYHVYQEEGHGWRKRETIEHFYKSVDQFLRKHVIFK